MLERIGLFFASLAAGLVVAIAIVEATPATAVPAAAPANALQADANTPPTEPPVQVDTIYLPARIPPKTITVHHNVPPTTGDDDGGSEEGGD